MESTMLMHAYGPDSGSLVLVASWNNMLCKQLALGDQAANWFGASMMYADFVYDSHI